jgi:hypothetical protein
MPKEVEVLGLGNSLVDILAYADDDYLSAHRPSARLVLGFLRADSPRRTGFPPEVYAFYDQGEVKAMLAAAGFDSIEFVGIGECILALAKASAIRAGE